MNWINRVMLACVRGYLTVIFYTAVTFFSFLRRLFGRRPIKMAVRKKQTSYWIKRNDGKKTGSRAGHPLIASQPRGGSILGQSMKFFLKEGKLDYAPVSYTHLTLPTN